MKKLKESKVKKHGVKLPPKNERPNIKIKAQKKCKCRCIEKMNNK